jgi:hypothetical protein
MPICRTDSTLSTPTGKSVLVIGNRVKPLVKKYFCFTEMKNGLYQLPSRPNQWGVAQGHQCGTGMRWTRMALLTRALEADGKDVWSRHPKGWCQVRSSGAAGDGGKSAGLTEESAL